MEKIVVTDINDIDKIKSSWVKLLNKNKNIGLYENPEVFSLLFKSRFPNSKPYIVLFQNENQPAALILGAVSKKNVTVKIGYFSFKTPELNCLDVEIGGILLNGENDSKIIVIEYFKSLLKQKQIDKLEIQHISENHPLWDNFKSDLDNTSKAIYKLGIEWIGKIRDSSTGEVYSENSSKTKATFRRKDKKLLKHFNDQLDIKVIKTNDDINYFLELADAIGRKSYQYAIDVGVKNNQYWKTLAKLTAEKNLFRGYLLLNNSTPIAYVQGLIFEDIFYLFATSFDPEFRNLSPGGFLLRKVIELLVEEKVNKIHFGYGEADYKRLYGTESIRETSFRIYGFSIAAKISKIMDNLSTTVNEKIINILEKTGLLKKIKKTWRSLLSKK